MHCTVHTENLVTGIGTIRLASGILLALMRKVTLNFLVDEWETIDPTPDLHALFLEFNQQFFWGRLVR